VECELEVNEGKSIKNDALEGRKEEWRDELFLWATCGCHPVSTII
jgi:hypothetical protein